MSLSGAQGLENAQYNAQLRSLQREDSGVRRILTSCSHAALYVLENSTSVHWKRVGIEGFFYVVERDSVPRFKFILRNQTDGTGGDFVQTIDDSIKFEVKEGTFFYQIGQHGDVRGLWFHDKGFMPKFINTVRGMCQDLRIECDGSYDLPQSINAQVPIIPVQTHPSSGQAILNLLRSSQSQEADPAPRSNTSMGLLRSALDGKHSSTGDVSPSLRSVPRVPVAPVDVASSVTHQRFSVNSMNGSSDTVTISRAELRKALFELVESDVLVDCIFNKLRTGRNI